MPELQYDDLLTAVARAFHERYEMLAPTFGWETQERSRLPWDEVPEHNRELMRATVGHLIQDGVIEIGPAVATPPAAPTEVTDA